MKTKIHLASVIRFLSMPLLGGACLALCQCASNGPLTTMNAASVNPQRLADDSRVALRQLYQQCPQSRGLGNKAKGILVFPSITKGGLMVGGMAGNGALIEPDGRVRKFYQTAGLSYGLQAGVQQYGYALFLMDSNAIRRLDSAGGWEVGSSPSLVIVDQSMATELAVTNIKQGTYAFLFHRHGLMGGLGLQGSTIKRISPQP